jgi:hypothetical protein
VQTQAGQKPIFSKRKDFFVYDTTTQVQRNFRARVNDGVELFVGDYKSTEN